MTYQEFIKLATLKALNVTLPYHKGEDDPFYKAMKKILDEVYEKGEEDGVEHAKISFELAGGTK